VIRFLTFQWRLVALLLLSASWLGAFPVWRQWISADPLNTSISLAPAGKVETEIQVRVPETYSLHFLFERNGVSFDELKTSIGAMGICKIGYPCPKGVPVSVRWSIAPEGGNTALLGGDAETQDSSGWSQAHVYRQIATVSVPPGRYAFTAEVLRPVPELARLRVHIAMQLQPKSTTTWQLGLAWWGAIAQYVVALPLAVGSAAVLLWRAGQSHHSSRRARG
jgi:hypothetical protein